MNWFNLIINNSGMNASVEMGCNFYLPNINTPEIAEATRRLERATDELDIYETAGNVQIAARLCIT